LRFYVSTLTSRSRRFWKKIGTAGGGRRPMT